MNTTRAIGIVRVSRKRRDGNGHSPEVQRRLITPFAERQGWDLVDLLNENEIRGGNVSGGADPRQRPGFGPALERVERGGAAIILAADLSRLFRDIDHQRATIAQIEAAGGEFWTVANGRVSHDTAESELTANLHGSINHFQRRYARDKSWLAVEVAIEEGKVPWSQTAPGYLRNDDSTLRPDATLRPVIRRAFKMRADGSSIAKVRAFLAEHGIERSYHGTMHLLRDRVYLGEIHFGTHTPNVTAHDAIVDRDVFEAVQRRADSRGRKAKSDRLLARLGVLTCSGCGGRMVVGTQRQNGRLYPFYRCGHVREDCDSRQNISAELVEGLVVAAVQEALAHVEGRASAVTQAQEAAQAADQAQASLEEALRSFTAAGVEGEPSAVERLTKLREDRDAKRDRADDLAQAAGALTRTAQDWDKLTHEGRRDLIQATIAQVIVKPGRGPERVVIEGR